MSFTKERNDKQSNLNDLSNLNISGQTDNHLINEHQEISQEDIILNFYFISSEKSLKIVDLMNLIAFGGNYKKKISLF